jgi:hypothetical protein
VWFRRGRLFMVSPVRDDYRRCQAETPLIDLFKFASPALFAGSVVSGEQINCCARSCNNPTLKTVVKYGSRLLLKDSMALLKALLGSSNAATRAGSVPRSR